MPCAVNETTAVTATTSSTRPHPDAAPVIIAESARTIDCESAATHESLVGTSRHRRWYARFLPLPTSTSSQPPRKRDQG
jgi:hypothetical protein